MGRKKKVINQTLPSTIELISNKTGVVREFSTDHAFRLLTLQKRIGLGSYELFNTHLYRYEDSGIKTEQSDHSNSTGFTIDRTEPISESDSGVFVGED
jgi:hypothetical protein